MASWTRPPGGVDAVIVGGGPAGMVLGLLLARAGCEVVVLEKHKDFLRVFRGDTIHPSTLETLEQLGLADAFLDLPHVQVHEMTTRDEDGRVFTIPFRELHTPFPFVAFVPQWDFLNFVHRAARRYPRFRLVLEAEVVDLLEVDGRVLGVRYRAPDGLHELPATLTIGADGRDSRTRELADLKVVATSPPMDVLWFAIPRHSGDTRVPSLRVGHGHLLALFDRGDYWQCAHVVQKGHEATITEVRATLVALAPFLADRVDELSADHIRRLTVRADRLQRWYIPGYLAIGDAAHAMSPVGGLGINVAIQDAVAAANVLWKPLRAGKLSLGDLRRVQRRRATPVRLVQAMQGLLHRAFVAPALSGKEHGGATALRVAQLARRPLARLVALGPFRPRVRSPEADEAKEAA